MMRKLGRIGLTAAAGLAVAAAALPLTATPASAAKANCIIREGVSYASGQNCGTGSWRVRIVCVSSPSHAYLAYSPWGTGRDQSAAWCYGNQRRQPGSTVIQYR